MPESSEVRPSSSPRRSRSKLLLLAGIALAAAVALFAATQVWVALDLVEGAAAFERLELTGQQLNASISPVAIAGLAAALALTIAGLWLRRLLGLLVALLGAGIVAIAVAVLGDPWGAASVKLAEATGLAGAAQPELVRASETSPLIAVAAAAGAALVLLGASVLLLGGRWKAAGRKYETAGDAQTAAAASGGAAAGADREHDRISDWDELSRGDDPTSPGGESPESHGTR